MGKSSDMMVMLRSLLQDKFRLLIHREQKNASGTVSGNARSEVLVIDSVQRPMEN